MEAGQVAHNQPTLQQESEILQTDAPLQEYSFRTFNYSLVIGAIIAGFAIQTSLEQFTESVNLATVNFKQSIDLSKLAITISTVSVIL